jgi:ABC-type enterochelin transport system permease subunit
MPKDELSPEQIRAKLVRSVTTWRKWAWLYKANVLLFMALFWFSWYQDKTRDAILFLFLITVFLLGTLRQNLFALVLKMLPPTQ